MWFSCLRYFQPNLHLYSHTICSHGYHHSIDQDLIVPFRYLITCFAATRWTHLGWTRYWLKVFKQKKCLVWYLLSTSMTQWSVYNESHLLTLMSHHLTASGWSPWVWPWLCIPTYLISSISLPHTFPGWKIFLLNFVIFPYLGNSALTQGISSQILLLVSSWFPWPVSPSLSWISHPHIITGW